MAKLYDADGAEVEAFLPDEVNVKVTEALAAKETEFNGVKTELEGKLTEAQKANAVRANEFAQFRRLNDEQVAQLAEKDRIIYENQVALDDAHIKSESSAKDAREAQVDAALRAKAGTDDKLFNKMKEVWGVIAIDANTPEQIEAKTRMVLGAIHQTEPNLVASIAGFGGGEYIPPATKAAGNGEPNFADTPRGQAAADELGLKIK